MLCDPQQVVEARGIVWSELCNRGAILESELVDQLEFEMGVRYDEAIDLLWELCGEGIESEVFTSQQAALSFVKGEYLGDTTTY